MRFGQPAKTRKAASRERTSCESDMANTWGWRAGQGWPRFIALFERSVTVSTVLRRTTAAGSCWSECSKMRWRVSIAWEPRWSYRDTRWAVAGRKSRRRRRTREKERILGARCDHMNACGEHITHQFRVCGRSKLRDGKQVEVRGMGEPLVDGLLRAGAR